MLLDALKNVTPVNTDKVKKTVLTGNCSNGHGSKTMFHQKDGNLEVEMTDHMNVQVSVCMVVLTTLVLELLLKEALTFLLIIESR